MADDSSLSASELRKRYHRGGTAADDDLTAAQLRARHGIASNRPDFSTSDKSGGNVVPVVVVLVVVLAFVAAAVMLLRAQIMTSS